MRTPTRICLRKGCNRSTTGTYCDEHKPKPRSPSTSVTKDPRWRGVRQAFIESLGGPPYLCGICMEPIARGQMDVDHIVPVSRGGAPFDPKNLRVAHHSCNRSTSQKHPRPNKFRRGGEPDHLGRRFT